MLIKNKYSEDYSLRDEIHRMPDNSSDDELDSYSKTVVKVSETVSPSVVHIKIKKKLVVRDRRGNTSEKEEGGSGSGFIISSDGA